MPGIGETLREARMRRQVDIADVEHATKIRAKYLRALENEEFDLLPGPTFVRSFLKTYSEHLGLDSRRLVEEYRTTHEGLPEEPPPALAPGRPPRGREGYHRYERRPLPTGLIVAGAVVGILLLFLILGLTGGDDSGSRNGRQAADRTKPAPKRPAPAPARPRPKSVAVRVSPVDATYVCVDRGAGQAPLFEGTITSPKSFRGKRLRLNLGRSSAHVTADGQPVDLGTDTLSVGLAFTPGKPPRRLPPGQRPCSGGATGASGGAGTGSTAGGGGAGYGTGAGGTGGATPGQ